VSYVDDIREQIFDKLREGEDTLRMLDTQGPGIIRRVVNVHLDTVLHLPGASNVIADMMIGALKEATSYGRTVIAAQRLATEMAGSPDALDAAAKVLGDSVGGPAGDLSGEVRLEALQATRPSNWSGSSAEAYVAAFDGQSEEVAKIATMAAGMSDALFALSDNIESYYLSLLGFVISIVAIIVGIVVLIATWETIVGGILGIITALIGIAGAIVTGLQMNQDQNQTIEGLLRDLKTDTLKWPSSQFST
jgi:uncharacterized protein YukE